MSRLENTFGQMECVMENSYLDLHKFVEGNKSAGTRVRKNMQELKNLAQDIRIEVQKQKNS